MAQQTQNSLDVLKVGELVEWLWPDILKNDEILSWPPDVFAVVALLLQRSSAYLGVLRDWPHRSVERVMPTGQRTYGK
jgi:hypothetical protein